MNEFTPYNFANFTLSAPQGQVPHYSKKTCTQALEFMELLNYSDPKQYLKGVVIQKGYPDFDYQFQGKFLSHKHFQCLLKCSVNALNRDKHVECHRQCFEKVDHVMLNWIDGNGSVVSKGDLSFLSDGRLFNIQKKY